MLMSLKQEENQLHTVFSFAALRRKGQTQLSTTQSKYNTNWQNHMSSYLIDVNGDWPAEGNYST